MKNFFVVLGGMGTLATVNFLEDLNRAYRPKSDQEYLNYLVVNHASIPDRTKYILDKSKENPLDYLKEDILQTEVLKPDFYVMICNTAHYFYDELSNLTGTPLINMIDLIRNRLRALEKGAKIGLFATEGTVKSGLFEKVVTEEGLKILKSSDNLQGRINDIIYKDVKESGLIDFDKYYEALEIFKKEGADHILIGCTEGSYINSNDKIRPYSIIDSEKELVNETLKRALFMQKGKILE